MDNEDNHGNTGLPYGLCEKYGIPYPPDATPEEVWNILATYGIYPPWADEDENSGGVALKTAISKQLRQPQHTQEEIEQAKIDCGSIFTENAVHYLNRAWKVKLLEIHKVKNPEKVVDAIYFYTRNGHEMRELHKTGLDELLIISTIDEFLNEAPVTESRIYRGLYLDATDKETWAKSLFDIGTTTKQNRLTSWSSDVNIAAYYARNGKKSIKVLLVCDKPGIGSPIDYLSAREHEREILLPSNSVIRPYSFANKNQYPDLPDFVKDDNFFDPWYIIKVDVLKEV